MNYKLIKADLKQKANQIAIKNTKIIPASWKMQKSAVDWYYSFMERHHDITLLRLESYSLSRATALNKLNVQIIFNKIENQVVVSIGYIRHIYQSR